MLGICIAVLQKGSTAPCMALVLFTTENTCSESALLCYRRAALLRAWRWSYSLQRTHARNLHWCPTEGQHCSVHGAGLIHHREHMLGICIAVLQKGSTAPCMALVLFTTDNTCSESALLCYRRAALLRAWRWSYSPQRTHARNLHCCATEGQHCSMHGAGLIHHREHMLGICIAVLQKGSTAPCMALVLFTTENTCSESALLCYRRAALLHAWRWSYSPQRTHARNLHCCATEGQHCSVHGAGLIHHREHMLGICIAVLQKGSTAPCMALVLFTAENTCIDVLQKGSTAPCMALVLFTTENTCSESALLCYRRAALLRAWHWSYSPQITHARNLHCCATEGQHCSVHGAGLIHHREHMLGICIAVLQKGSTAPCMALVLFTTENTCSESALLCYRRAALLRAWRWSYSPQRTHARNLHCCATEGQHCSVHGAGLIYHREHMLGICIAMLQKGSTAPCMALVLFTTENTCSESALLCTSRNNKF